MQIELTPQQVHLLLQLVDDEVRDLGPEIRHTDSRTYKEDLRNRRRELRGLHDLLVKVAEFPDDASAGREPGGLIGTP
jgi:hypothetical protein